MIPHEFCGFNQLGIHLKTTKTEAQKIFQEVGDKAAESVACVHLAQALAGGGGGEVLGFTSFVSPVLVNHYCGDGVAF